MEPTPKAKGISDLLNGMADRDNSIRSNKCVMKPIGCGRQITQEEINSWKELTLKEYTISGLCDVCQAEFFGE